jgi:hypothetical protein
MFTGDIMRVITRLILERRDNVPFVIGLAAYSCEEFIDNVLEMCNGQIRISHTFFCKS